MLATKFIPIIKHLVKEPDVLKKKCPEVMSRLQSQGKAESEGTGNKVTNHEAAFASVLEEFGFTWIPKKKKNDHLKALPNEGYYYIYQVNGTQASIDFEIMYILDSHIQSSFKIDCKNSTTPKLMLNDGWFENDILYLFTWECKKEVKFFIGISTFTTEEENMRVREIRKIKDELNSGVKNVGDLNVYFRFANQYSLKKFTDDFIKAGITKTIDWISSQHGPSSLPLVALEV
jgi:hypothetical protein